jgi:hypothetical protein
MNHVALLKLKKAFPDKEPVYSHFGDADTLLKGQGIFCLADFNGLSFSLTKGIVSSKDREAPGTGIWLQVDAAVSEGAGGGLLLGNDGLCYGMILGGLVYENINFILPSNEILGFIDKLMQTGSLSRPWLGIRAVMDTREKEKIIIEEIFPSSPLIGTNIIKGNTLSAINDIPVTSVEQARNLLLNRSAGNLVKITSKTGRISKDVFVLLKTRPDFPGFSTAGQYGPLESLYMHFGFSVYSVPSRSFEYTVNNKKGVIHFFKVIKIKPGSYLDSMGVKPDDYLGIISDFYYGRTRYLEVIHIPGSIKPEDITDVDDLVYQLAKDEYDENIL